MTPEQQWLTRFLGDGLSGKTFDRVHSCTIFPNEKAGDNFGDPLDIAGGGGAGFGRDRVPVLRGGDYAGAVTLMTVRVASVIAQDAGVTLENQPQLAAPRQRPESGGGPTALIIILIIIFVGIP